MAVAFVLLSLTAACGGDDDGSPDRAPTVSSNSPLNDAVGVPLNAEMSVAFSEAMDPSTLTTSTFALKQGSTTVAGAVSYSGNTATFNPTSNLSPSLIYTATVTEGAKGLDNNALANDYVWAFTTGSSADTSAPTVSSADPLNLATSASTNRSITARFSEAMNPTTLNASSFTVKGPGNSAVSGVVSYFGMHATFNPDANLAPNTLFNATISTAAKDLAGNALASSYAWSFTTGGTASMGPDPVLLGLAGDYVILAKSGIDTVPGSVITGDLGVSPIDSTAVTGFSLTVHASNEYATSAQVTGKVRAPDYASPTPALLTTAISNMETAYTDAAGRPTPDATNLGAGEIGGLTLAPGLYKWGTGVSIATDVTLQGGPNDVWIFQISGDLTQASNTNVTLVGASPKNVFWQASGQVLIGTGADFRGIALCETAIILGTGASVNGRLLAQTAVTLDQNAVTQPAL
ncbi:MAG: ice-binding family protein [Myxococcota bacterium]